MIKRLIAIAALLACIFFVDPQPAYAGYETERKDGKHFTLVNETGQIIDQTALSVFTGDEFIAPDNRRYKVVKVQDTKCYCKFVGIEKTASLETKGASLAAFGLTPVMANSKGEVAIYHTHSDESYVPTDGTESKTGKGGIYQVGDALTKKLKNLGVKVVHDTTAHDPHDPNAYYRSRRTASRLMRQGALAIIDVHRDAVPPNVYATKVSGENVTKVKLVVGRQNSNMSANLAFAKRIKAYLDKNEPGLAAGIFMGKGSYNQDLTPRALLVEVGAHTNSKIQAERGVSLFANAIPAVLGVKTTNKNPTAKPLNVVSKTGSQKSDWSSILWVIVGLGVIYGAYILINRGRVK